jgi:hypothetical protein
MCTQSIGTIREFKTKSFRVVVDAIPEDDLDLSFDETGEVARNAIAKRESEVAKLLDAGYAL